MNMLFTFVIGQCFVTMLCTMEWGVFLFFAGQLPLPVLPYATLCAVTAMESRLQACSHGLYMLYKSGCSHCVVDQHAANQYFRFLESGGHAVLMLGCQGTSLGDMSLRLS